MSAQQGEGQDAYYSAPFFYIHNECALKRALLHAERIVDILHNSTHLPVNNRRLRHRSSLRGVRCHQRQLFFCHLD